MKYTETEKQTAFVLQCIKYQWLAGTLAPFSNLINSTSHDFESLRHHVLPGIPQPSPQTQTASPPQWGDAARHASYLSVEDPLTQLNSPRLASPARSIRWC
ncbi:hypothetical protein FAVG1_02922 [Fusarium avenaceum]|nr:hypothetical protein FAVG1_02922 [Fusarium avenaceum]